jgi:hypothetical protein
MRVFSWYLVFVVILGSPVWTSVLIALVPRRLPVFAYFLCAIQALLAFAVWWFFGGGGIGGEAHLSESWQMAFGFALLPFAVVAFRFLWGRSKAGASPNGGPATRLDNSDFTGGPPSVS